MLSNVKLNQEMVDATAEVTDKKFSNPMTGVYENCYFNLHFFVEDGELLNRFSIDYGVADNIEQVLAKYKHYVDDPENNFCIEITEVRKDEEPERDGWRWEKWGTYIGNQESQAMYLYNEPDIESVLVFGIYKVKSSASP